MRLMIEPGKDKEGNELAKIEDIMISYFIQDKDGNAAVKRETIEVPVGCSKWAKEAMVLGFFEFFDTVVAPQDEPDSERQKRMQQCRDELAGFKTLIDKARGEAKDMDPKPSPLKAAPEQPEATQ